MSFLPKDYVGVHTRVDLFHKKYPHGSIETHFEVTNDIVYFKATVTTDKCKTQTFSGSSFGRINKEKAFEKLETVAVGRALAFAGFETQSGIASREEMENFQESQTDILLKNIKGASDIETLLSFRDDIETVCKTDKQKAFFKNQANKRYKELNSEAGGEDLSKQDF